MGGVSIPAGFAAFGAEMMLTPYSFVEMADVARASESATVDDASARM
jgi:hypothetical protein